LARLSEGAVGRARGFDLEGLYGAAGACAGDFEVLRWRRGAHGVVQDHRDVSSGGRGRGKREQFDPDALFSAADLMFIDSARRS